MGKIFEAAGSADEDIQENSLHCLREIAVQEYDFIQLYFVNVCAVTGKACQSSNNKIGAAAFEFWTSLCEEEIDKASSFGVGFRWCFFVVFFGVVSWCF